MPLLPSPADRRNAWPAAVQHGRGWPLPADGLGGTLTDAAAALAAAVAVGSGVLLASRRLAGALPSPPAPAATVAVACAGVLLVAVADRGRRSGRAALLPSLSARCGLLLATLSLAVPALARDGRWHVGAAGVLGWLITLVAVLVSAGVALRLPSVRPTADGPRPSRRLRRDAPKRRPLASPVLPAGTDSTSGPGVGLPAPTACPGRLRQEQQRYEPSPDADCLRGRLILAVAAGAKTAHGHVGFCPAFVETPRVEVTTDYDGVEAVVTAAEVLPWGVRLECRLAEPAEEPIEIPVDFLAQARV
jgi:hypothetical protein